MVFETDRDCMRHNHQESKIDLAVFKIQLK
jgi:hypothetical protein